MFILTSLFGFGVFPVSAQLPPPPCSPAPPGAVCVNFTTPTDCQCQNQSMGCTWDSSIAACTAGGPGGTPGTGHSCSMEPGRCFCDATCSRSAVAECRTMQGSPFCMADPACDAFCTTAQTPNVECIATFGPNTGDRLTVDPNAFVAFNARVDGVLGGSGEGHAWSCSPQSGGQCPGDFPSSSTGLSTEFPDPGQGQSAAYTITVAVRDNTSGLIGSDFCTITVCNQCGTVSGPTYQCQQQDAQGNSIPGVCYPPPGGLSDCQQTCNNCVACNSSACLQGVDCVQGSSGQPVTFIDMLSQLFGRSATRYPVGPEEDTPLVGGPGTGKIDLSILRPGNFSDFMGLLNAVFTYLVYFAIPLAVIVFLIAGIMILTSQGESAKLETGKKILLWGVIGFVIVLLAKGILAAILAFLT